MGTDRAQHDEMDRLPVFGRGAIILAHSELAYNPCNDLIFPCVINAQEYFSHPLGKYYVYYAPHNAPGGICLAYASSLRGPWIEYGKNPLIVNQWLPHHDVEHVSSPYAVFIPEECRLFLYYHGDNETTHYAISEDGKTFTYGGVAIDWNMLPGSDVTAYARVFPHTPPGGSFRYVMLFMSLAYTPGSWDTFAWHGLYRAWSNDARIWHVDKDPMVSHRDLDETEYFVCSPWLLSWHGKRYVVFHKDWRDGEAPGGVYSDLYAIEVDAALKPIGPQRLFCSRQLFGEGSIRIADPCLLYEDDTLYLFASIGPRLNQNIGLTTATVL